MATLPVKLKSAVMMGLLAAFLENVILIHALPQSRTAHVSASVRETLGSVNATYGGLLDSTREMRPDRTPATITAK
jgi:hypothetical protein